MRNRKNVFVNNTLFLAVLGVMVLVTLTGCGQQMDILTPNIYISSENQINNDQEQSTQQEKMELSKPEEQQDQREQPDQSKPQEPQEPQEPKEQSKQLEETDIILPIPFSLDEYLTDEEFVFSGGIRLGMGYEEVLKILGRYDEANDNTPGVKSITKDGVHYGFDLEADGVYQLLDVTMDESSNEVFPREIKIGDSIEDVLNKFPGKDKKLREWDYQIIYGPDQDGKPRAYLEYINKEECYHFTATTTKQVMRVNFDRENRVRSIEMRKED